MKYVMGKSNIWLDLRNRNRKGGQWLKRRRITMDFKCVKRLYILQKDI